jgi:exodeoxyribonuclease VII large subunit
MGEPSRGTPARAVWGVASLLVAVGDALAARFGAVALQGELSGFTRAASGHCYFSVKDADGAAATLRCAMFRRAASLLAFAPSDGQRVELRGRLAVYEPRGELQFVVEAMQRVGAGNLYEEFLRLRARLQDEGLFDAERKRALPAVPRAVGVVTSLQAAALHDVLTSLARRAPQLRVVVYPSPVQGADAPAALVQALATAAARREVDTLLLVRGGGSLEDLWAFNDERVVRAVAGCPLPVVCGVGHETDVTLADLAADLRAPTPTAAAELCTPAQADLLQALRGHAQAMRRSVARRLQTQAQALDLAGLRLARPARALAVHRQALQRLAQRLSAGLQQRRERLARELPLRAQRLRHAASSQLALQHERLDGRERRLQALDPHAVLARGYAWVEGDDGRPVVSAQALRPGDRVSGVWADGRAALDVRSVDAAGVDGTRARAAGTPARDSGPA